MERIIKKTRKIHLCCFCGNEIPKGAQALYMEGRNAKYKKTGKPFEDEQIGIEYYKVYYCYDGKNVPTCDDRDL